MMKRILSAIVLAATVLGNTSLFAQPENGGTQGGDTMMTRWGKSLNADLVLPEYPRPQMMRRDWLNLNGFWELEIQPEGNVNDSGSPQTIPILVPFPIESKLSGLATEASSVTYKKRFRVPGAWPKNSRILLHFGAVDWETSVRVNGKPVGTHRGGYDAFSFDITDALMPDAEQTLLVAVTDPTEQGAQPRGNQSTEPARGRHTSVTGIWQTVWLEPVPEVSIRRVQLTPDFDGKSIKLQVFGENMTENHIVKAEVFDGEEFVTRVSAGLTGP